MLKSQSEHVKSIKLNPKGHTEGHTVVFFASLLCAVTFHRGAVD